MSSSRSDVFVEQGRLEADHTAPEKPENAEKEVLPRPLHHTPGVAETAVQTEQVKADHYVGDDEKEIIEEPRDESPVTDQLPAASHDRRSDASAQIPMAKRSADTGSPPRRPRRRLKTQVIIPSRDNVPGKKA